LAKLGGGGAERVSNKVCGPRTKGTYANSEVARVPFHDRRHLWGTKTFLSTLPGGGDSHHPGGETQKTGAMSALPKKGEAGQKREAPAKGRSRVPLGKSSRINEGGGRRGLVRSERLSQVLDSRSTRKGGKGKGKRDRKIRLCQKGQCDAAKRTRRKERGAGGTRLKTGHLEAKCQ